MSQIVRCIIKNRETELCKPLSKDVEEYIDTLTQFSVPGAFFVPAYHRRRKVRKQVNGVWREVEERVWDGKKHLYKNGKLPTGLFLAVVMPTLLKYKWRVFYRDLRTPAFVSPPGTFSSNSIQTRFSRIRPYQTESVQHLVAGNKTGGLIMAATGSGKTFVVGVFAALAKTANVLFIVDELTLLYQAQKELASVSKEPVGVVGEGVFNPKRITVATIQTLWKFSDQDKFLRWLETLNIVIIDEIHVQMNRRNFGIVETIQAEAVYGLTATLRLKKKEVRLRAHALTGPVLYTYPLAQGVKENFLTQPVVIQVPFKGSQESADVYFKQTQKYVNDYNQCIVKCVKRNDVIELIARTCIQDSRRVIILADRVDHLKILYKRLQNLKPRLVYGKKSATERAQVIQKVETGDVRLVITNKVFEKGVNIKAADTGIDCSAMRSKNKVIQRVGRLARLCPGKRFSLYFDISDFGNRFENSSKSRLSAYSEAKIPVLKITRISQYHKLKAQCEEIASG